MGSRQAFYFLFLYLGLHSGNCLRHWLHLMGRVRVPDGRIMVPLGTLGEGLEYIKAGYDQFKDMVRIPEEWGKST